MAKLLKKDDPKFIKIKGRYYDKKDVIIVNGEYVVMNKPTPTPKQASKEELVLDNYTNTTVGISKVRECYITINKPFVKGYSSKTTVIYSGTAGTTLSCCSSILNNDPSNYLLHPDQIWIRKNDKYVTSTTREQRGVYSLSAKNPRFPPKVDVIPNQHPLARVFEGFTYGFELECSQGSIPDSLAHDLQFTNLYDGSINGPEFASNILRSNELVYLRRFLEYAYICTSVDRTTSGHVHVGGVPYSDDNLLSMYMLFQREQSEIDQYIPAFKRDFRFLAAKGKDHCAHLPLLINKNTDSIYRLLLNHREQDIPSNYLSSTNKWNFEGRYHNVNFLNYMVKKNSSGATVEIRSLHSTYSFEYIIIWMIINVGIIKYAINHTKKVIDSKDKILLEDVVNYFLEDHPDLLKWFNTNSAIIKKYIYKATFESKNNLERIDTLENYLRSNLSPLPKNYAI